MPASSPLRHILALFSLFTLALAPADVLLAEEEVQVTDELIRPHLEVARLIAADRIVIESVVTQNTEGLTQETIAERDAAWSASEEITEFKRGLLTSSCAERIRAYAKSDHAVLEGFVMDNQGALVCAMRPTSDYWQGDEEKWQIPVERGEDHVGNPALEGRTNAVLIQVSVPIRAKGEIIGALTLGLGVRRLKVKLAGE